MRPTPEEVLAWFAAPLSDLALTTHLLTLETDPNWAVFKKHRLGHIELELWYLPTGAYLDIVLHILEEAGGVQWHPAH